MDRPWRADPLSYEDATVLPTRGWAMTTWRAQIPNWRALVGQRWVTSLSLRLTGANPVTARWGNWALHVVNAGLVGLLGLSLLGPIGAAVAGALVLLHPLHLETVALIASRSELLCTFGVLVACLGAVHLPKLWSLTLLALGVLLACGAKEAGIIVLPLVLAMRGWAGKSLAWPLVLGVAMVAGSAIGIGLAIWRTPFVHQTEVSYGAYVDGQLSILLTLLGLVLVPIGQSIDHAPRVWTFAASIAIAGWSTLWLSVSSARKHLAYAGVWTCVALAPRFVVQIPDYLHEHHLSVPLIGLAFALGSVSEAVA